MAKQNLTGAKIKHLVNKQFIPSVEILLRVESNLFPGNMSKAGDTLHKTGDLTSWCVAAQEHRPDSHHLCITNVKYGVVQPDMNTYYKTFTTKHDLLQSGNQQMWLKWPQMSCNVLPNLSIGRPSSSWMAGQLTVRTPPPKTQNKQKKKEPAALAC